MSDNEVKDIYAKIPVFREGGAYEEIEHLMGTAEQNPEKPEEWVFTFPRDSAFMRFIQMGDLKALSLGAYITNVRPKENDE